MVVLTIAGCQKTINGFSFKLDKGEWWHDVYLTNTSGEDLHEVNVTLTLIGENGKPCSENRYYSRWGKEQTVKVSLSVSNSPDNVQKISFAGSSTEGPINSTWVIDGTNSNAGQNTRPAVKS
jgi:hypothetical protein